MLARTMTAALIAMALALAACADEGAAPDDPDTPADADGGADDAPGDAAPADGEELSEEDLAELEEQLGMGEADLPEPVSLEDGVAATVDGAEIGTDAVDGRLAGVLEIPEIAEQIEAGGPEAEGAEEALAAQVVTTLVLQEMIAAGAAELDVEPSDEDVAALGEEIDDTDLEASGVPEEDRDDELRFFARVEAIQEALVADLDDADADAEDADAEDADAEDADAEDAADVDAQDPMAEMDPGEMALQQWFTERLAATDVQVDEAYGVWDPMSGQVQPLGGMMPPG